MARVRLLERYNGRKLEWLHDSLLFVVLVVAAFTLFRYVVGFAVVSGNSMEPVLTDGECVLFNRLDTSYDRGDVVSVRVPSGEYYVKRVIATAGDVVDLRDGSVYVNGARIDDPWAANATYEETGAVVYPYHVTEGNVFVLGDNRDASMDSRAFGEVSFRQIQGTIILRMGLLYATPLDDPAV